MKHIYYTFVVCIIIYSILTIKKDLRPETYFKKLKNTSDLGKENLGESLIGCSIGVLLILFTLISYLGLLTSNWWLFLILVIKDIMTMLIRKIFPNFTLGVLNNIITILVLAFAVINTYHIHVQIFN